jgi:hypothetical protein
MNTQDKDRSGAAVRGELEKRAATSADISGMVRVDGSMSRDQALAAVRGEVVAKFNINDMMIVTLTSHGAEIWNQRYADLVLPAELVPKKVGAGYILKAQLWELMQYFGPHIGLCRPPVFVDMLMAHVKPVTQVSPRAADAPSEPRLNLNAFSSYEAYEIYRSELRCKSRAADALDSQPTMHKDVEWLLECADMAKRNPELATTLRNKCRSSSSQPTDGEVRNG